MIQRIRSLILAAYLLLCIILGGSAQGIWTNLALQLLGIVLLAWAALAARPAEGGRPTFVYALLGIGLLFVMVQLIPIPAGLWTELPGRAGLEAGLGLAGEAGIALPISETPYRSVMTLFAFIPGLALFISIVTLRPSPGWLAFAIAIGMALNIGLGAVQVASGPRAWALYSITNFGAVGFFANINHMAALLLVTIPFASALLLSSEGAGAASKHGRWTIGIATLGLAGIGIALIGTRAVLALSAPVLIASIAIARSAARWRAIAFPIAGLGLAGGIALLAASPIGTAVSATDKGLGAAVETRQEIWRTTATAIRESFPVGTGLGSFEPIYMQYEDPSEILRKYVNHAHNDYLELVLELGAVGLVLILLFLGWWAKAAVRIWTSRLSTPFERAATIASAALLAQSVVDYPLRTAALSAILGVALAIMAQPLRRSEPAAAGDRRPARHVKLG